MAAVHLLGGGWTPAVTEELYGPFVADSGGKPIVLIVERRRR